MPRFSVIVPAYNTAPYLAATLASVLAQTEQDFELIVVDDGSTDETRAVAERFAPRAQVITQANGGPAKARNAGIRAAQGEYLALLDSDDLWLPEKLAVQRELLDAQPALALCFAEAWMFTETSVGTRQTLRKIGYTADPTLRLLLYGDFIPNSTVVLRRSCFDEIGWFDETPALIGVEDYEYWLRMARTHSFAGQAQPLAWYRIRVGNLMGAGQDIERGLRKALLALHTCEQQDASIWQKTGVDRARLFARLHLRAAFACKERWQLWQMMRYCAQALQQSAHPLVWRWLLAMLLLRRWS